MSNLSTPSRLLDLPVELREQVLRYALKVPYRISPRVYTPRDAFVLRLPALTKTCHLLRKESLPLYFEENTFHFNDEDVIERHLHQDLRFEKRLLTFGAWCEAAGVERLAKVRRVSIRMSKSRTDAKYVLLTMTRFGKVEVELEWLRSDGKESRYEVRPAPETIERVVKRAMERTSSTARMLLKGAMQFCNDMMYDEPWASLAWKDLYCA